MDQTEILKVWESIWGELSPDLRERFLARKELGELAQYPDKFIRAAINEEQLLKCAVEKAEKWFPGLAKMEDSAPNADSSIDGNSKSSSPRPPEVAGSNHYGSGLVHSPGFREFSMVSRCEHCGAHIPDGSMHDC